jgi:hypothetical protein
MPQGDLPGRRILPSTDDEFEDDFYPRYLAAKKAIDDRALNRHVWETLRRTLPQATAGGTTNIIEIGAGIGTMLARIVDWGLLIGPATYLATDSDAGHLRAARRYLSEWAGGRGHDLSWQSDQRGRLQTAGAEVTLVLAAARAEELASRSEIHGPFHLLIAHAVLDLIDFSAVLPSLLALLGDNGLAYLTCNFDGDTVFLPACQGEEEQEILRLYHASMDRRHTGASRTGRHLLGFMQRPGLELLAAGSSDWLVHPSEGSYSPEEAFFLHAIITTVEHELAGLVQPPPGLAAWARLRRRQVEEGELSFLARHLDLLARRRPALP